MKALFAFLLAFAWSANAAISTATKPHILDSAATPKVSQVDDNDEALLDKINEIIDTTNLHNSSGSVVGDLFSSTGDMRLLIDSDNNGTNRWMVTANGATDTLWRILESGAWKGFGDGYVSGKVVASDSLIGATVRATGNLSAGGTFGVTGASTLAALSATTGAFSSNVTVGGTLGVTGLITATGGVLPGQGSDGAGQIFQSSVNGLKLRGVTGSTNDFYIAANDNSLVMRNPTGTSDAIFGNSVSTGSSFTSYGVGSLGSTDYERASIIHTGSAAELRSQAGGTGTVEPLRLVVGSTTRYEITNAGAHAITGAATFSTDFTQSDGTHTVSVTDNTANAVDIQQGSANYINVNTTNAAENVSIGNATTNPTVSLLGTGTKTIDGTINTDLTASRTVVTDGSGNLSVNTETGTGSHVKATSPTISGPTFSGTITTPLTASLPVFTNGSSALTTNAITGTGSVVMSTSPTLVTPALGVATATSIALGGGEAFTYGDTSFTITVSTGMTTTPSGTANASRVGRIVTLEIPELTGTSNAATFVLSGVPSGWRPSSADQSVPIAIFANNSVSETGGYAIVGTTGTIELIRRDATPWTSSGGKSVYGTITYLAR